MKTKLKQTELGMIPEDWKVVPQKEVARFVNGRAYSYEEFKETGIPIVRIQNLTGIKEFVYSDLKLEEEKYINKGDLIYAWSATFGPYVWDGPRAIYHYHIWKIICDERQLDKIFFYYALKHNSDRIKDTGTGSIFTHITKKLMDESCISLPPLLEQKSIASILSCLDSKIKINYQMNKTLESICQAIFKHWFIDFEFSNEEGKPYQSSGGDVTNNEELGKEMPKGWKVKIIGDVVTVKGGSTPSTKNPEYWDGKINWCTPKDLSALNSPILLDTERKITESGLSIISSNLLPIGTVLLSSRAPIGYLAISEIPVAINQGFIAIVCDKILSKFFMLFWLQHNMDIIESRAHGTTFQEINKTSFRNISILVPSIEILNNFTKLIEPLYCKAVKNQKEITILSHLRDLLLPKLMSGKIRVPVGIK